MIINNITNYHSSNLKPKAQAKSIKDADSKIVPQDTYEVSGADRSNRQSASYDVRGDLLQTVKKRIHSGFYDSKDVLDDLSNSFAQALHQTLG